MIFPELVSERGLFFYVNIIRLWPSYRCIRNYKINGFLVHWVEAVIPLDRGGLFYRSMLQCMAVRGETWGVCYLKQATVI